MMEFISFIRKAFDINNRHGFWVPLGIPILLWWLSLHCALTETGLVCSSALNKPDAVAKVNTYVKTVNDFPGEPIISVYDKRNGNREARLVVRTMGEREVIEDPVTLFIFPALMGVLLSFWGGAMVLRFTAPETHPWRKKWAVDILMGSNILATTWFFGLSKVWEALSK